MSLGITEPPSESVEVPPQKTLTDLLDEIEQRSNEQRWRARKAAVTLNDWVVVDDLTAIPGSGFHSESVVKAFVQYHNIAIVDKITLVKALRIACKTVGEMSDVYCGLNDMTGRNALAKVTSVLNGNDAGEPPVTPNSS